MIFLFYVVIKIGPTNPQFNTKLQAYREELLPVVENWDQLSDTSKEEMSDMGEYFCKMHLLVNTYGDRN